ncbi:hypothetical protein Ddye_008788 [Dipteronia dyeriana]|uniref:Reverse transcriptase domain-containing protein n=1 Tax=Dipteronia dyeriana TaxID=168575 RepID=A0AAE0CLP7_9ROSI|nr:hypothetical protein Ddye_008788 [Dipteronia dyeriana]
MLRKGSKPLKPEDLKNLLQSLWQLPRPRKLTLFLKGYFDLHFSNVEHLKCAGVVTSVQSRMAFSDYLDGNMISIQTLNNSLMLKCGFASTIFVLDIGILEQSWRLHIDDTSSAVNQEDRVNCHGNKKSIRQDRDGRTSITILDNELNLHMDILYHIPQLVTDNDNENLCRIPSFAEIKDTVYSMDPNSAPGPDGFSGSFYQHVWELVVVYVVNFVQAFVTKSWLLSNLNYNFVVLILKVPGACRITQYKPIALANFSFKIIPKILANRGVRQGDPLSPLIFFLAEEVFNRGLSNIFHNGRLKPIIAPKGCFSPTHLLYANDIFIFYRADSRSLRILSDFIDSYGAASGQLVSSEKSNYFLGRHSLARKTIVESILGFKEGIFPFVYLGVPVFRGSPRGVYFQPLLDRVKARFAGWKGCFLSMAGHAQLIQSVIQSMLIHCFCIYKISSSTLLNLLRCCCNFLWFGNIETHKLMTVP